MLMTMFFIIFCMLMIFMSVRCAGTIHLESLLAIRCILKVMVMAIRIGMNGPIAVGMGSIAAAVCRRCGARGKEKHHNNKNRKQIFHWMIFKINRCNLMK